MTESPRSPAPAFRALRVIFDIGAALVWVYLVDHYGGLMYVYAETGAWLNHPAVYLMIETWLLACIAVLIFFPFKLLSDVEKLFL